MSKNFDQKNDKSSNPYSEISSLSKIQPKLKPALKKEKPLDSKLFNKLESQDTLPPEVQEKMETSFGQDFSDVNIHKNSESAEQLGAKAFAQGKDIHFAPGEFQPENKKGQELIGHELTHIVQQKQGVVQPGAQGNGLEVNKDPGLEKEADEKGKLASEGELTGEISNVSGSGNFVQGYEIEGPWNINNPVHENLTLQALIKAGIVPEGTPVTDPQVMEYIRGVIWNDDPEGLLFDNNDEENDNYSSGYMWNEHFSDGKKKAKKNEKIGVGDTLTARSHFGDLQFIHAMATADGIKAEVTRNEIMMWAEFVYKVGTGEIPANTMLGSIPVSGLSAYFSGDPELAKLDIDDLFHVHEGGSAAKRAMGSMMHMIQDSHALGHADRQMTGKNSYGAIESFHSYNNQDGHVHGGYDGWDGKYTYDAMSKLAGAKESMDKGAQVLKYCAAKTPWVEVKTYMETTVFNLAPVTEVSGPGAEFIEKNHEYFESIGHEKVVNGPLNQQTIFQQGVAWVTIGDKNYLCAIETTTYKEMGKVKSQSMKILKFIPQDLKQDVYEKGWRSQPNGVQTLPVSVFTNGKGISIPANAGVQ